MTTAVAEPLSTLEPRSKGWADRAGFERLSARDGILLHGQGFAGESRLIQEQSLGGKHRHSAAHVAGRQRTTVARHQQLERHLYFFPSRTNVAVLLTIAWSFAAALSARISWKKRKTTQNHHHEK